MYQKDKKIEPGRGENGQRGAEPHNRVRPLSTDKLFIFGKSVSPNKDVLHKYFPMLINRSSKGLYLLLATIYANPLRTVNGINDVYLSNADTIKKNIAILIDLGYLQQENRPRKIVIYDAFVIDKVYRITAKGVKALSAVTGY